MLEAEYGFRATERGSLWRRYDNRRLCRQERETLRYRERPSRIGLLPIEIAVVMYREVMRATLEQPDDSLSWMTVPVGLDKVAPTLGRRFSDSL